MHTEKLPNSDFLSPVNTDGTLTSSLPLLNIHYYPLKLPPHLQLALPTEFVSLDVSLTFLKSYCEYHNLNVYFTPHRFLPNGRPFVNLPAALIQSHTAKPLVKDTLEYAMLSVHSTKCSTTNTPSSSTSSTTVGGSTQSETSQISDESSSRYDELIHMITLAIKSIGERILNYVVWVYDVCFYKYTLPIYLYSSTPLMYMQVLYNCFNKRLTLRSEYKHIGVSSIQRDFYSLLYMVQYFFQSSMKVSDSRTSSSLKTVDLKIYSLLSILFNIPSEYTPWIDTYLSSTHQTNHCMDTVLSVATCFKEKPLNLMDTTIKEDEIKFSKHQFHEKMLKDTKKQLDELTKRFKGHKASTPIHICGYEAPTLSAVTTERCISIGRSVLPIIERNKSEAVLPIATKVVALPIRVIFSTLWTSITHMRKTTIVWMGLSSILFSLYFRYRR